MNAACINKLGKSICFVVLTLFCFVVSGYADISYAGISESYNVRITEQADSSSFIKEISKSHLSLDYSLNIRQIAPLTNNNVSSSRKKLSRWYSVSTNSMAAYDTLKTMSSVDLVSRNIDVTFASISNDPQVSNMWYLETMEVEKALEIESGSEEIIIAHLDTGARLTHEDLQQNIWVNPGEIAGNGIDDDGNGYIDDIHGWDFGDRDSDPTETSNYPHGTSTLGLISATKNNAIGMLGLAGPSKAMIIKGSNKNTSPYSPDPIVGLMDEVAAAITYAVDNGARVMNGSFGSQGSDYEDFQLFQDACEYANSKDVLFVVSAGNDGRDIDDDPFYPASFAYENVISVAATDSQDNLASFSNYGKKDVDVAAPGKDIRTTSTSSDIGYVDINGTSASAPMVASLAALLYAQDPNRTAAEVKSIILNTVDKVSALEGKVLTGGRINFYKALSYEDVG
ncbi:MAG: hypothetical protein D6B27_06565, partial [Gammaproteobacteria bacterium]